MTETTPCLTLVCRVKLCLHKAHHVAHRAEHPLHMSYLAAVFYSSNASYGYIALACCLAMLLSGGKE